MRLLSVLLSFLLLLAAGLAAHGQTPPPEAASDAAAAADRTTQAAAVTVLQRRADPDPPDFLEHLVDSILGIFNIRSSGNTVAHYALAALLLVLALLARRLVSRVLFALLRRIASKTSTTLDDKLFLALEGPVTAFIMLVGIFAALKVLKLSPAADVYIANGSQVAFSLTIFWALWRGISSLLEHAQEISRMKELGITAFMPWIRKTLMTVLIVVGLLLTIQSLGYDVKAILTGLGIGGLAFALAAQDTLANIFGAIVVAIDQPFKIGETVKIGQNTGTVEDIGLRSTRIRLVDKSLMVIPNKSVASDPITNLSRFTKRRVEQVLGLTYDTTPAQMEDLVRELRRLIDAEPEIDRDSVHVYFRDFSPSSLDIWVVYETNDPDFTKSMVLKQRLNLTFMRAVEKRGLALAFPTQTIHLAGGTSTRDSEADSAERRQR